MTVRRPPGGSYETAVEKEIRESMARGEFDELDGLGRPLPLGDADADDELWWIKRKLKDEGFVQLPRSLQLRSDATVERERARHAGSAAEAVDILEAINVRLRAAVRIPLSGPSVYVPPFDIDKALAQWHADHPEPEPPERPTPPPNAPARHRWWHRRR